MPLPPPDDAQLRAAVRAAEEAHAAGYRSGTGLMVQAAASLGIKRQTLHGHLAEAERRLGLRPAFVDEPPEVGEIRRVEQHDHRFWKREADRLRKQAGEMARVIEELGGVSGIQQPPLWQASRPGRRGRSALVVHLSDMHDGEVIRGDEIDGVNEFSPEICERRVKRLGDAAVIMGQRWAADTDCKGALLICNGDLTSGDIHDELSRTNALTSIEQVHHAAGVISALIVMLRDAYGVVHVVGTPGNHGRTTLRPTAKLYAALSYDTLVMRIVADRFSGDDRVTFQIGATDQVTPVFREAVFTTHGDKMGTAGGQGFAGRMLPIIRGAKKILEQQDSIGRRPTIINVGHYHATGNPHIGDVEIFANGSVPGVSEYGRDLRGAIEPPQQWIYLIHDRWRVRERVPVKLEDPELPPKPTVRVPAGMAA